MFINRNREFLRTVVADLEAGGSTPTTDEQPVPTEAPAAEADTTAADDWDPTRAQEKIRKANAEAKSLRDRAKAAEDARTAAEDRAKQLEADAQRVPTLEAELLRANVALELGLPPKIAKRLVGTTREELLADAEELVAEMAPKKQPPVRPVENLQPGSGTGAPSVESLIATAQQAGDWREVLRLQNQKLVGLAAQSS